MSASLPSKARQRWTPVQLGWCRFHAIGISNEKWLYFFEIVLHGGRFYLNKTLTSASNWWESCLYNEILQLTPRIHHNLKQTSLQWYCLKYLQIPEVNQSQDSPLLWSPSIIRLSSCDSCHIKWIREILIGLVAGCLQSIIAIYGINAVADSSWWFLCASNLTLARQGFESSFKDRWDDTLRLQPQLGQNFRLNKCEFIWLI